MLPLPAFDHQVKSAFGGELGPRTTESALAFFDSLEPVGIDFMLGDWQGSEFPTGHPLDGALEAYRWRGKRFDSVEDVYPLLFTRSDGSIASVNPALLAPTVAMIERWPGLKSPALGRLFQTLLPILTTRRSGARLRLTEFRGKVSATMIYDRAPINDVFRKLDENTVFGLMDRKGAARPFFFVLLRERMN